MKKLPYIAVFAASAAFSLNALVAVGADGLAEGFANPPRSASPHVWWHWMNGNVSREGITLDLESMKDNGFGGATIVDAGHGKAGDVPFASEKWYGMVEHAVREARRLGLEIGIANCSGWSSSGGPWITASNSMKTVVFTETQVSGGKRFKGRLPRPEGCNGFYRDIAVLAFPVPEADRTPLPEAKVQTSNQDDWTQTRMFSFSQPTVVSGVTVDVSGGCGWIEEASVRVESESDGKWSPVGDFGFKVCDSGKPLTGGQTFSFTPVSAGRFRVSVRSVRSYPPRSVRRPYEFRKIALERRFRLPNAASKAYFRSGATARSTAVAASGQIVRKDAIRAMRCGENGEVSVTLPSGEWILMRIGYASNGMMNHPATKSGLGLECDKLDRRALDIHFDAYVGRLVERLRSRGLFVPGESTGLTTVLVDSYEVGPQNWTHGFGDIFHARLGYDILPWLVTLTGRVVDGVPETESFLSDFRKVIGELFVENYAEAMADRCHRLGLRFQLEPYGNIPAETAAYAKAADIPTGEFWIGKDFSIHRRLCRTAAMAARRDCRKIVGAEAFSSDAHGDRWSCTPFDMKAQGDLAFRAGINRLYLHSYVHQPWKDRRPGMTMSKWGSHFDRNSTWWPQAREWVRYLTRCQYLLQEGVPIQEKSVDSPRRRYADGTEGYFVAVTNAVDARREFTFPVVGRVPEFWDPYDGSIRIARDWHEGDGKTSLDLNLGPVGSVFVMFRPKRTPEAPVALVRETRSVTPVTDGWSLDIAGKRIDLDRLADWTDSKDPDIRYFSGTATYRVLVPMRQMRADSRVLIDLGKVNCLATVIVNGHEYPALWKPPFRVDVTDALKATNEVVVKVSNLWANRLIGDDFLPKERRTTFATYRHWTKNDKPLSSGLLGPVAFVEEGVAEEEQPGEYAVSTKSYRPGSKPAEYRGFAKFRPEAGDKWIPIEMVKGVSPGSVADFSGFGLADAPAGKHGWLKRVGDHFEFENRPGERVRFCGANLVTDACCPDTEARADELVGRILRSGYNAVRLHHFDETLTKGTDDPSRTTFDPVMLGLFDRFVAKLISHGIYITVDLYSYRKVAWKALGSDDPGNVHFQRMKALIHLTDAGFENWKAYALNFLNHVNPYTGRAYKDEPAIALICLVNEGALTQSWAHIVGTPEVEKAWGRGDTRRIRQRGDPEFEKFCMDVERKSYTRMREAVKSVGAKALLTDLNNGPNFRLKNEFREREFDYFDNHGYVDHPWWLGARLQLPARTSSKNFVDYGGTSAFDVLAKERIPSMPYTVTEWNACGSSPWRSQGGLWFGALAATGGWDGIWRFTWSHSLANLFDPPRRGIAFFDVMCDPVMLVNDRAVVSLFLRGDAGKGENALRVDRKDGTFVVETPRTQGGFAFAGGTIDTAAVVARVSGSPTTVTVIAVDGAPSIRTSGRLFVSHLTDVKNSGASWLDGNTSILEKTGSLPLLARAGTVDFTLGIERPELFEVWACGTDGARKERIPSTVGGDGLSFTARISKGNPVRLVYEVALKQKYRKGK